MPTTSQSQTPSTFGKLTEIRNRVRYTCRFSLVFCFFVVLLIPVFADLAAQAQPSLKFIIRVDDILSRNTTILPRSIEPFQDAVEARGGVITWGVMPHRLIEGPNLDGVLANELKASAAAGHEISLHGYIHICQRCNQSSHEMFCTTQNRAFSYEQQAKLVSDGIDLLVEHTGIRPVSFIPPGHVSDSTTWRVLVDHDIPWMSTTGPQDYLNEGLFNLPPDSEYTWALTEAQYAQRLQSALADIRKKAEEDGVYNLLLHDPFIRSGYENAITIRWMAELLDSLNAYYGDRIEYITLTDAARALSGTGTGTGFVDARMNEERPGARVTLHQNYPNPFNPQTGIRFFLQQPSRVRLEVYDTAGSLVRVLADGSYGTGDHRVRFDATDLPSGIYVYSLVSDGLRLSRKMVLVR